MTRFIVYMLLVAVIFLSGIVVGISKQDDEAVLVEDIEEQTEEESTIYISDEGDQHLLTQKFASLLERITASIYEAVVIVMYKIAKLFTG